MLSPRFVLFLKPSKSRHSVMVRSFLLLGVESIVVKIKHYGDTTDLGLEEGWALVQGLLACRLMLRVKA